MTSAAIPQEGLEAIAHGLDHPEGICVTPDGTVFVSGEAGQLYEIVDDEPVERLTTGGFLLGLAADAAGRIYACDLRHRCVWRVEPGTWEREIFTAGTIDEPFVTPNWGAFDSKGRFFVTDSGGWNQSNGRILVVTPGRSTDVWSTAAPNFPNGLAVAPDESCVFVLESTPGRLLAIELRPDGSAGDVTVLAEMGDAVPDGVAVAGDGSLVIACYRPDVIYRWHPDDGRLEVLAEDPQGTLLAAPTNVIFVGPELDEILVPNIGRWHLTRFRPGFRGTRLFYPTDEQLGLATASEKEER
jgi:gluconolactonase